MKFFYHFATTALAILSVVACSEKEQTAALPSPEISLNPKGKIVLDETKKDETALTISWKSVADDAKYEFCMSSAKAGVQGEATTKQTMETSVSYTVEELQNMLLKMGFNVGTNAAVKFTVKASSGDRVSEATANGNIVLYTHIVRLKTPEISLKPESVELTEEGKDSDALEITWTDASVEEAYVEYTLSITKADDNSFENAVKFDLADALGKKFIGNDLQSIMRGFGYKPGETASAICRVEAIPTDATIETVVSETKTFSVKLYERAKNTDIPEKVTVLGDATEFKWDMNAEGAQLTCIDPDKGIFSCEINLTTDTFKFYFNQKWTKGPKPGVGDYYWSDITIPESLGDNDYFRVLLPGKYRFVVNTSDVTIECTLLQATPDEVYVHGKAVSETDESADVPLRAVDKAKGIYEGVVNLKAGASFCVTAAAKKDRAYYCHPSSKPVGLSWKITEDREKEHLYSEMQVADGGEYKLTVDFLNHTLVALAVK